MTTRTVQIRTSVPGLDGPVPLGPDAEVDIRPNRGWSVGDAMLLPEPVTAAGGTDVALEVTPAGCAYEVTIGTPDGFHGPIFVVVNPGGPIALVNLPVVDPETLDVVDPGPAWWAVADGIVGARDSAVAAATSASQSASAAAQSATAADGSATTASTKAGQASSSASAAAGSASTASTKAGEASASATSASNSATSAGQAKTAAEQARDAALAQSFAGVDLGTTDLNAFTTPGIGRQASSANATLARNYPLANFIGTVEVLRSSDPAFPTSGLMQRATPIWSSRSGFLFWIRRKQASGDAWSEWRPITSQKVVQPSGQAGVEISTYDDQNGVDRRFTGIEFALTTQHLDTVTVAGVYACASTNAVSVANGYPVDAPGIPGLLKVAPLGGFREQTFSLVGSNSAAGRSIWVRVWNASTWSPWREYAEQRIDKTAGIAVYTRDHAGNREQITYGDTGWRGIALDANIGIGAAGGYFGRTNGDALAAGDLLLRRVGSQVFLTSDKPLQPKQDYSTSTRNLCLIPAGFTTNYLTPNGACRYGNNNGDPGQRPVLLTGGAPAGVAIGLTPLLDQNWGGLATGGTWPRVNGGVWVAASWFTTDSWPTSLPGTPSGTIPNA